MFIRKISFAPLALTIALSACTFGEGPELSLPGVSSSDASDDGESSVAVFNDADNTAVTPAAQNAQATALTEIPSTNNIASDQNSNSQIEVPQTSNVQTADEQSVGDQSLEELIPEVQVSDVQAPEVQAPDVQAPDVQAPDVPIDESPVDVTPQSNNAIDLNQPNLVRIPATDSANAPKIDGSLIDYIDGTEQLGGEWRFAAQRNARNESLAIANRMFGEQKSSLGIGQHHWAVMHDGVYLYLLIVSDDAGEHYQDTNEERKPWKDDSIEIFIDGNNSQLDSYDGVDDFHITVNLQSADQVANSSYVEFPLIRQSDTSATIPSDFLFSTGLGRGPMGQDERGRKDIYELRIKLSELNIVLDQPFGIEIQINDDDDGGTRDEKWGWHHPAGNDDTNDLSWQNPSVMGQAVLVR